MADLKIDDINLDSAYKLLCDAASVLDIGRRSPHISSHTSLSDVVDSYFRSLDGASKLLTNATSEVAALVLNVGTEMFFIDQKIGSSAKSLVKIQQ
ncbi:MAG TPA: hypothetical protein VLZ31_08650 [Microbacteriaceae bacterium]|nr:hypothetical protein [Microbacteriaceae bacterium]